MVIRLTAYQTKTIRTMRIYQEITNDRGYVLPCATSNNDATYYITSARGHDLVRDFEDKYHRVPTSRWFNKHFRFERIR